MKLSILEQIQKLQSGRTFTDDPYPFTNKENATVKTLDPPTKVVDRWFTNGHSRKIDKENKLQEPVILKNEYKQHNQPVIRIADSFENPNTLLELNSYPANHTTNVVSSRNFNDCVKNPVYEIFPPTNQFLPEESLAVYPPYSYPLIQENRYTEKPRNNVKGKYNKAVSRPL